MLTDIINKLGLYLYYKVMHIHPCDMPNALSCTYRLLFSLLCVILYTCNESIWSREGFSAYTFYINVETRTSFDSEF